MFKPLLASPADLATLRYPLIASPKLDGIRAVVRDGVLLSRSLKPIPNKFVQEKFKHLEYFDGELIVGSPTAHDVYRKTNSFVMSHDERDADVQFYVFDHIQRPELDYLSRAGQLPYGEGATIHSAQWIGDEESLLSYEQSCLDLGYEGLILRDPQGKYKFGRSTAKEQTLLKLKRFLDDEAEIVGFEELMHNGNEATTNELGRTARSSHQENQVPMGKLGALVVMWQGIEFRIGTGFDDATRQHIWDAQPYYLGKWAKFKYFPIGMKEAPRHPVYLGLRHENDMEAAA
jgi:DNA ligase-1